MKSKDIKDQIEELKKKVKVLSHEDVDFIDREEIVEELGLLLNRVICEPMGQHYWCDGLYLHAAPLQQFLKTKSLMGTVDIINENSNSTNDPWSQDFEVILKFGEIAVREYSNAKSLKDCLPKEFILDDNYILDLDRKKITIQLL